MLDISNLKSYYVQMWSWLNSMFRFQKGIQKNLELTVQVYKCTFIFVKNGNNYSVFSQSFYIYDKA